ncbi:alkaline phosphatase family protein [Nocardia sp. NPDC050697]|uniref:alkaline phosphatase family protein n=1 Tax=Nocardia sp. NPDC050697 TaxID=3155158 RepID=UPI0033FABAA1
MLLTPRYGAGALADLLPSVLAALGVPGERDPLALELDPAIDRICVLLVDGLGSHQLAAHAADAPTLTALPRRTLTAGFPSTTATSLASFGTGLPPGEHGVVGYLIRVPGFDRAVSALRWTLHGDGEKVDLLRALPPEEFQPRATAFERAAAHGVTVTQVAPGYQNGSGLSRAVLRGCEFRLEVSVGDLVDGVLTALEAGPRALVYAYHADLDTTGHLRGPGTRAWRGELAHTDRIVAELAERLPPRSALLVTADHGMVTHTGSVDFDADPALRAGVELLAGEPRVRYVYTADGATADVAAAWSAALGADFAVLTRDEAIERGWFGPAVTDVVRPRIGDLVVAATGTRGVVRTGAEPIQSAMLGHHGSLTAAELEIPLAVATAL